MSDSEEELWEVMRLPEIAVEEFLVADDPLSYRLEASAGSASDHLPILALSRLFSGSDDAGFDAAIREAARLFRRAESHLTDRLGPGMPVEIEEETWTPGGLPPQVLATARCTLSLVTAWALPGGGGWCVLEVHQEDPHHPITLLLHAVAE